MTATATVTIGGTDYSATATFTSPSYTATAAVAVGAIRFAASNVLSALFAKLGIVTIEDTVKLGTITIH